MKTKFLLPYIMFALVVSWPAHAQTTVFQKLYFADSLTSFSDIVQTTDGGYLVGGAKGGPPSSDQDYLIVKLNSIGQVQWSKQYGLPQTGEYVTSVIEVAGGGYCFLGATEDTNTANIGNDIINLVRLDVFGNILFSKLYSCTACATYAIRPRTLRQTPDDCFIICGQFFETVGYEFFMKTDASGNLLWSKKFNAGFCFDVETSLDSGFVTAGDCLGHGYISKTDANGNFLWVKDFASTSGSQSIGFKSIDKTSDGGYIFTGYLNDAQTWPTGHLFLMKTDGNGTVLWAKEYYNPTKPNYGANYVQETYDGGFVISSSFRLPSSQPYDYPILIKTYNTGNIQWAKYYAFHTTALNSVGYSTTQTADSGFAFAATATAPWLGYGYIVKTDPQGNTFCYDSLLTFSETNVTLTFSSPLSVSPAVTDTGFIIDGQNVFVQESSNCSTNVGISENNSIENAISIYPNPCSGKFNVLMSHPSTDGVQIEIYNVLGEKVYSATLNMKQETWNCDLRPQPNGIYFLHIKTVPETGSGEMTVKKIIINK